MELEQFNLKIPATVKTDFQVKVLKNKKEFGTQADVLTKLLKFFIRYGMPDVQQSKV